MFKINRIVCRFEKLFTGKIYNYTDRPLILNVGKRISLVRCLSTSGPTVENAPSSTETTPEEIDYARIANGDPELEHKLRIIAIETEVLRQEGRLVPDTSFLKDEHWKELLNLPSRSGRTKYLQFLFKLCKKKESESAKKVEKQLAYEKAKSEKQAREKDETFEDFVHTYDLSHNSIFLRFRDTTINHMYNNRLVQAIQFGQKLVIDCGYEQNMTKRENLNTAKQLMLLFADNRVHIDPFDLHFCNINPEGPLFQHLLKHIPTLLDKSFPINVHENSYTDLFPKEKLVYLTPHCQEVLHDYNHDDVYIVGGIVDRVNSEPLSLAKAKREGIRMAKFPFDKYLQWGAGSGKSLTINQCGLILLDLKCNNNWENALRHVPRRKLVNFANNNGNSSTFSNYNNKSDKRFNTNSNRITGKWSPSPKTNTNKSKVIKSLFTDY